MGAEGIMETSRSSQFCSEPEAVVKIVQILKDSSWS